MYQRFAEMRTFVLVATHSSLAGAARELGVSSSAVSKQVGNLERRLGVRLLQRTTRRIALTQAGRLYEQRVRAILSDLDDLETDVRGLHTELRGTLRISVPQDLGRIHLSQVVAAFAAERPHLRVEFEMSDRKVDVIDEEIDVAIRVARLKDSTLLVRRLGRCERVLCASPRYIAMRGKPAVPSDLHSHDCIEYDYADSQSWSFRVRGQVQSVAATGRLRSNSFWAMRSFALAGAGIALLPLYLVRKDLEEGALVRLLDEELFADLDVVALLPPGRQVSAKTREFLDFVLRRSHTAPWTNREGEGRNRGPVVRARLNAEPV